MKKLISILLVMITLTACTKRQRIENDLYGKKWNVTKYTIIRYSGGNETYRGTAENVGSINFENDDTFSVSLSGKLTETPQQLAQGSVNVQGTGKCEVYGSNEDEYDAKMNCELSRSEYYVFYITKESNKRMVLYDRSQYGSMFADGYTIEWVLEKD
jgi:hypothetical protein